MTTAHSVRYIRGVIKLLPFRGTFQARCPIAVNRGGRRAHARRIRLAECVLCFHERSVR